MNKKPTDVRVVGAELYFLPLRNRVPLKFGPETVVSVTCARVKLTVADRQGRRMEGWGETPLSVQWVWPSKLAYEPRHEALKQFCIELARAWTAFPAAGHPIEVGYDFQQQILPEITGSFNRTLAERGTSQLMAREANKVGCPPFEEMPYLAALVCCSAFDIALHDAFAKLVSRPVYQTYGREFMNRDLGAFLTPAEGADVSFAGKYPCEFFVDPVPTKLPAWHLVGGLDAIESSDLKGSEPKDGYPVLLRDWIRTDGLNCLKVKLRGNDGKWDYDRLVKVGQIAVEMGVNWLTADFNCTVTDPAYVNEILDRLVLEQPRIYQMILYVEQPFPYDLEANPIDVHSVSARKPLFMDESAHDWHLVKLGRSLGWSGVALKTCKTQTGALLSLCWAKAHGMTLMVQDLTNPMLAQIPHVLLAAHAGTIMGIETNAMQFYPEASLVEAKVHPGLYRRRGGCVDLSTIRGAGFGYRVEEIGRELPEAAVVVP